MILPISFKPNLPHRCLQTQLPQHPWFFGGNFEFWRSFRESRACSGLQAYLKGVALATCTLRATHFRRADYYPGPKLLQNSKLCQNLGVAVGVVSGSHSKEKSFTVGLVLVICGQTKPPMQSGIVTIGNYSTYQLEKRC